MGILDSLAKWSGWTKILRYRIVFGVDSVVGVYVEPCVAQIMGPDYIRLWASYEAKIILNLGFPKNLSAMMALTSVAKVLETDITPDTDCFQRAGFNDVIRFVHEVPTSGTVFTGDFFAKGSLERTINTYFPLRVIEQQIVYSGLALMQYAILMNRSDTMTLDILTKTARNFVTLYVEVDMGLRAGGLQAAAEIPTLAYTQALFSTPDENANC